MGKAKGITSGEPLHAYWNKGGFILCTSGHADIRIDERWYRLTKGVVFVVTPLVQVYDLVPSPDFETIPMVGELKFFYPMFHLIADTGIPLKAKEKPCWQISDAESAFVMAQYRRMTESLKTAERSDSADERSAMTSLAHIICFETMLEIVSNHIRRYPAPVDTVNHNRRIAYGFILALHENYHTQRTVNWYASLANMSTGHFSAIIRQATGQAPSEWIASVTTTYAKLTLEQTDKSIKEIAQEFNFPEQFTFRKYFKRHTGMAPTEYRHAAQNHPAV
ncbi:helix-turn-helix transcriptional regulator [bacterium]|nr:helix-turn-helix transcriptional regulator [bacterium]